MMRFRKHTLKLIWYIFEVELVLLFLGQETIHLIS